MVDVADRLIDAMIQDTPDYRDGFRPAHATGIGATGFFHASVAAGSYCSAEQFGPSRPWVPVTVRFSNGSGSPTERDLDSQIRGMAVKFHLGAVTEADGALVGERTWDLIAVSFPVFFARTAEAMFELSTAILPQVVRPERRWRQLVDLLRLCPKTQPQQSSAPMIDPARLVAFSNHYPPARAAVFAMSGIRPPASYVRFAYHALHAFDVVNSHGVHRLVRFTWEPVDGVRQEARTDLPTDYLRQELAERLGEGPAQFMLRMQVSDPWDDATDPTVVWPASRRRVYMGRLVVEKLVDDQARGCQQLSFNPTRLVPGIACSDDPMLHLRQSVYEASCARRGGLGCPVGV